MAGPAAAELNGHQGKSKGKGKSKGSKAKAAGDAAAGGSSVSSGVKLEDVSKLFPLPLPLASESHGHLRLCKGVFKVMTHVSLQRRSASLSRIRSCYEG